MSVVLARCSHSNTWDDRRAYLKRWSFDLHCTTMINFRLTCSARRSIQAGIFGYIDFASAFPCLLQLYVVSRSRSRVLVNGFWDPFQPNQGGMISSDDELSSEQILSECLVTIHRVSKKHIILYGIYVAGLTDCKNFNGYRVRDNLWIHVCNQCSNF